MLTPQALTLNLVFAGNTRLSCVAGRPASLLDALREVLEHERLLADAGVSEAVAQALAHAPAAEAVLDAACGSRLPGLYQLLSHTDLDRRAAVRLLERKCCCAVMIQLKARGKGCLVLPDCALMEVA